MIFFPRAKSQSTARLYWEYRVAIAPQARRSEELPRDSALQRSVSGTIVGISPAPSAMSPGDLVSRLTLFLNRSCGELAWITNTGVCQSFRAKLNAALASISANDRTAAQGQL